jgi:hypothetical protein
MINGNQTPDGIFEEIKAKIEPVFETVQSDPSSHPIRHLQWI